MNHRRAPEELTAAALLKFIGQGLVEHVEELPVTLNGQQVRMDLCTRRPDPASGGGGGGGELQYTAWEIKTRLTYKVVEQARRWIGRVHRVYVVINEPLQISQPHLYRLRELNKAGVGVCYVRADGTVALASLDQATLPAKLNTHPDIRMIEHAFNAPGVRDRELAPPAGSTGKPTVTKARGYWHAATEYVRANPGCTRKELVLDLPDYERHTAAAMRKAIKSGEWRGVKRKDQRGEMTLWPTAAAHKEQS